MCPQKQTVLIVDDQPISIKILATLLAPYCDVVAASSGSEALELLFKPANIDLVLLDVIMPGMNGYEVCRHLKNCDKTKEIPVIFVTSNTESREEEIGLSLGAVDYISKPYRLPVILTRVRNQLRLKRKTDLLESLAAMDGLTGIPNRRSLNEKLDSEWRRAQRNGHLLSMVMMDIDYFKLYNDHYGHGAGDECLIQVANSLSTCLGRPGDIVARYGGEEFAALLPSTKAEGALTVAERFVNAVSGLALPHLHSAVAGHVTISAGCATLVPSRDMPMQILPQKADVMLYRAKSGGRNKVCSDCDGKYIAHLPAHNTQVVVPPRDKTEKEESALLVSS